MRTGPDELLDPDLFASGRAHEVFRRLRAEASVCWLEPAPGDGHWVVLRHADVLRVLRDPGSFTSSLGTGYRSAADGSFDPATWDPARPRFRSLNLSDPPAHGPVRRLAAVDWSRQALAAQEAWVRALASDLLERAVGAGGCDFAAEVAAPLPGLILTRQLGLTELDPQALRALTRRIAYADDPEFRLPGQSAARSWAAAERELHACLEGLLRRRQASPQDDLPSRLLASRLDGQPFGAENALFLLRLLILGGQESTTAAIAGGALALAEHPEQLDLLEREPALVPGAVEEILRWTSPVTRFGRLATRDLTLGGQPVRAGQRVVVLFPSANRDEAAFARPERFDVARAPNEHLAFGAGPHRCLGAASARLQVRVVLEELLRRRLRPRLCGPVEWFRSAFTICPRRLPVVWEAGPRPD